MLDLWSQIGGLVSRNRPRRKPQLWEDVSLALARRAQFEVRRRLDDGWMRRSHFVDLSRVGFDPAATPIRMAVVPYDMISRAIFLYGVFEISETRLVQAFLRPGMTFVDLGANIGYYTLIAAHLLGPQGRVYAFEPNHVMRGRLVDNIGLNGFENVVVHAEALARTSGEVAFYDSAWDQNDGISSILPSHGRKAAGTVPSLSLDDFFASLGDRRPDFIKMDIEGAELEVIEGGRRALAAPDAPAMIFEAHDFPPIASALRSLGYHIRGVDYSLEGGLVLREATPGFKTVFGDYEAPNYFAAKDPGLFDRLMERARAGRPNVLRALGRL